MGDIQLQPKVGLPQRINEMTKNAFSGALIVWFMGTLTTTSYGMGLQASGPETLSETVKQLAILLLVNGVTVGLLALIVTVFLWGVGVLRLLIISALGW